MDPSSSARPAALIAYARAGDATASRIEAQARRLGAALGPFIARCTEYHVPEAGGILARVRSYPYRESELALWAAGVGRNFQQADSGSISPGMSTALRQAVDAKATARWNLLARELILVARYTRRLAAANGPLAPLVLPTLQPIMISAGLLVAVEAALLIITGDAPRWGRQPRLSPLDLLDLLLQGFWYEGMAHVDPALFREFTAELDAVRLLVGEQLGTSHGAPRTIAQAEALADPLARTLDVGVGAAFPHSAPCGVGALTPFRPAVADSISHDHSAISYFPGEQVRLERLNLQDDYRISIAGLDPNKPAAPNNYEAVAITSQGLAAGNPYYEHVKQRFLTDLGRLPAGSTLHMEGHSMGGGMCFLLREDPEVRQALLAAGITVGSVITFGAVRPRGPAGAPRDEEASPFAGAEERHYVNADDSLALNVGAGHAGDPAVIVLDNGQVDDPTRAHTGYGSPDNYAGLPIQLQIMPYTVDPAAYAVYSDWPIIAPPPASMSPAPAPTPVSASPPTAAPTPVPTPVGPGPDGGSDRDGS